MTRTILLCLSTLAAPLASAIEARPVYLIDTAGERTQIAHFTVAEDGSYTLAMVDAPFTDHFLSMRPFKCLEGPTKHWCHVPYPYPNARNISVDFVDLEYDLLFLWKGASDYGIDTWNGIYYVLTRPRAIRSWAQRMRSTLGPSPSHRQRAISGPCRPVTCTKQTPTLAAAPGNPWSQREVIYSQSRISAPGAARLL